MPAAPGLVFDAIVLAFSRSELKDVVGTDALRSALAGLSKDMLSTNALRLQPLWHLLEEQPGFSRNAAAPPILLIKTWQIRLGLTVELPEAFGDVSDEDCTRYASECKVSLAELEKVLTPPRPATPTPAPAPPPREPSTPRATAVKRATTQTPAVQRSRLPGKHKKRIMVLGGVALVATIVSIILFVSRGSAAAELNAAALSTEIPLAHVRKSGAMIGATLTDASWLAKPEDVRRKQLEEAFVKAHGFEATRLMVFDAKGQVVASASTVRNKVIIAFPAKGQ